MVTGRRVGADGPIAVSAAQLVVATGPGTALLPVVSVALGAVVDEPLTPQIVVSAGRCRAGPVSGGQAPPGRTGHYQLSVMSTVRDGVGGRSTDHR